MTDISICLDFENKKIDAWVDGNKVVEILKSPIFFEPESIYFKHGIYQSFISAYTIFKGETPTQIVYYDKNGENAIEDVDIQYQPWFKNLLIKIFIDLEAGRRDEPRLQPCKVALLPELRLLINILNM